MTDQPPPKPTRAQLAAQLDTIAAALARIVKELRAQDGDAPGDEPDVEPPPPPTRGGPSS